MYRFLSIVLAIILLPILALSVSANVIEDSEIDDCDGDNTIEGSTIIDSEIVCTDVIDSTIISSKITNATQEIVDSEIEYALISGDSLDSGKLYYGETGYTYYGPRKLADIYVHELPPSPEGTATVSREYVAPEREFFVTYSSGSTGYSVEVNASSVGAGDSIPLLDNGQGNDDRANDGVYTSQNITVGTVESGITTGEYELFITVDDNMGNQWELTTNINVDSEDPSGSLQITTTDDPEETDTTGSRVVYLHMTAEDNIAVDGCRIANQDEDIEDKPFRDCETLRPWVLPDINEDKTVYYQVRDHVGLKSEIYEDSIELNLSELEEAPLVEMPSVNWGIPDSVDFRVIYEDRIDTSEIVYEYRIMDESSNITPWKISETSRITHDGLDLQEGVDYSIVARARLGSISPEGSIDFGLNMTPPEITSFEPSVNDSEWTSDPVVFFEMAAEGLDIDGFTYRFSQDGSMPNQNVDVSGEEATIYLTGMSPGEHHFIVQVLTKGGLSSDPEEFLVRYDNTIPSPPSAERPAASGSGSMTYNWTAVDHISGVDYYNVQIATDDFFENIIEDTTESSGTLSYDFFAERSDTYFFRVRAKSNAGIYGPFSTEDGTYFDLHPPLFHEKKPIGRIASTTPVLHLTTSKPSECFYSKNISQDGMIGEPFDLTGGNVHEVRTSLDEGEHTLAFLCHDSSGNTNSTTTQVHVDESLSPTGIFLAQDDTVKAFSSHEQDIEVELRDSGGGIGELPLSAFSFHIDDDEYERFTVNDRGNGTYLVSFQAPDGEDEYSITICYKDNLCIDDISLETRELRLEMKARLIGEYVIHEDSRLSYTNYGNLLTGFASDSDKVHFESSTEDNVMVLSSVLDDGNNFVFFVPSDVPDDIFRQKNRQLSRGVFFESMSPKFQVASGEFLDLSLGLTYGRLVLDGGMELSRGDHSVLIRHDGRTDDDRINITIHRN